MKPAGLLALVISLLWFARAEAAEQPVAPDVWSIKLGMAVPDLPDTFAEFACGTRGGPPSLPLTGFAEFAKCPREPDGLAEVYFRYDDELEYWARANNLSDVERF